MMPKVSALLCAVAILAMGSALAQTPSAQTATTPTQAGGGSFPVGPLSVYPGINLAHGYDDNLFLRPANRATSSYTIVSPYVRAEGKTGPHRFDIGLRIDHGRYHTSAADSYTDYALTGNGDKTRFEIQNCVFGRQLPLGSFKSGDGDC